MTNIKPNEQINIVIYNAIDGQVAVTLYAKDGRIWLNQLQMFELFATSKQTVSYHISNILKKNEFSIEAVGKKSLPTASDGKQYRVVSYSWEMILAVGYRVKGVCGTQMFSAETQSKLLYAVTHQTVAEPITVRTKANRK